ncbi:putative 3,4-dihydroxy-2-butanone kinase isoform X2 [Olea europaea var. sylvestris]|uniref:putative 3,4-dihydroxy-2-butanone kinase isoform X2 n=1 Tax=Olea europaea var. sylvestris TaxID=158386 RepID=UPI000C1D54B7|nr:putative 3,4-dihydroxy-2-butanone kinase isoform X2 [Olea europaea var. sylvestris]
MVIVDQQWPVSVLDLLCSQLVVRRRIVVPNSFLLQLRRSSLLSSPYAPFSWSVRYDIFCKAAYSQLKADSHSVIMALHWAGAFEAAIAAISKYGGAGASAGYRTLLDALIPASSVLKEKSSAGDDPIDAFVISTEAAVSGADSTKDMLAQAGRSSYVSTDFLHHFLSQGPWLWLHGTKQLP